MIFSIDEFEVLIAALEGHTDPEHSEIRDDLLEWSKGHLKHKQDREAKLQK